MSNAGKELLEEYSKSLSCLKRLDDTQREAVEILLDLAYHKGNMDGLSEGRVLVNKHLPIFPQ